ncbi:MAG: hypothetical protein RLZZ625_647 [Pseudomonadota bacterium]
MIKRIIHHEAESFSDYFALVCTKFLRVFADTFFAGRYGHRAVVLETVAGVPGMVGGTLQHLKSLRRIENDQGWIKTLLDEAENERMHLMTFIEIAKPNTFERFLIILAQGIFYNLFFCPKQLIVWLAILKKRLSIAIQNICRAFKKASMKIFQHLK